MSINRFKRDSVPSIFFKEVEKEFGTKLSKSNQEQIYKKGFLVSRDTNSDIYKYCKDSIEQINDLGIEKAREFYCKRLHDTIFPDF